MKSRFYQVLWDIFRFMVFYWKYQTKFTSLLLKGAANLISEMVITMTYCYFQQIAPTVDNSFSWYRNEKRENRIQRNPTKIYGSS